MLPQASREYQIFPKFEDRNAFNEDNIDRIVRGLDQRDKFFGLNLSQTLSVGKVLGDQPDAPGGMGGPLSEGLDAAATLSQIIGAEDDAGRLSTILSDGILRNNLSNSVHVEEERQICIAQQKELLATQKELEQEMNDPHAAGGHTFVEGCTLAGQKKSAFADSRLSRHEINAQMNVVLARKEQEELLAKKALARKRARGEGAEGEDDLEEEESEYDDEEEPEAYGRDVAGILGKGIQAGILSALSRGGQSSQGRTAGSASTQPRRKLPKGTGTAKAKAAFARTV